MQIEDIDKIDRFREPPYNGIFCDILWSDPVENVLGDQSKEYIKNTKRGCSFTYGKRAVMNFLKRNNLKTLIRAHEVQLDGYKMFKWGKDSFPNLITIFSAPNYCDSYNNKGAVIKLTNDALNIT
jgi:serine/threonine-protein phosphatase 2B catalytic subunit